MRRASAKAEKNPYAGQAAAVDAGKAVYSSTCITCHGPAGQGTGNVPPLVKGAAQSASDGEIFWYITKGDIENGMPSWKSLPEEQRWQVVTYIKALSTGASAASASTPHCRSCATIRACDFECASANPALHRLPLRKPGKSSADHD